MTSLLEQIKLTHEDLEEKILETVCEECDLKNITLKSIDVSVDRPEFIKIEIDELLSIRFYKDLTIKFIHRSPKYIFPNEPIPFELIECITNIIERLKEEN